MLHSMHSRVARGSKNVGCIILNYERMISMHKSIGHSNFNPESFNNGFLHALR